MRWKRRRSIGPAVAALLGLSLLTLAAPRAWLRLQQEQLLHDAKPRVAAVDVDKTAEAAPQRGPITIAPADPAPATDSVGLLAPPLPPLVRPGATHLAPNPELIAPITLPIVDNDDYADDGQVWNDYVVVEDKLTPSWDLAAAPVDSFSAPGINASADGMVASDDRAEIAPPPAPFDLNSLLKARDALQSLVGAAAAQAEQVELPKLKWRAPRRPTPQVRVHSPDDRLAMVPERSVPLPKPTQLDPSSTEFDPAEEVSPGTDLQTFSAPDEEMQVAVEPTSKPDALQAALPEHPEALLSQLLVLRDHDAARRWADAAVDKVGELAEEPLSEHSAATCAKLNELVEQGLASARQQADPEVKTRWLRTAQAIGRRLPMWKLLVEPATDNDDDVIPPGGDTAELAAALDEVALLTANSSAGAAWRDYLMFDRLTALAASDGAAGSPAPRAAANDAADLRRTAQRVLARVTDAKLTTPQRAFLRRKPLTDLRRTLKPWAAGPVRLDALAAIVERYENESSMRYSHAIAQLTLRLRWSKVPAYAALADHLDGAYRNANLRLAVTGELMNRLVPKPEPVTAPVRDRVGGADIRGRSRTNTELAVRLTPDDQRWRITLVARGDVRSQTYSDTWPARVRNAGELSFEAEKEVVLGPSGLEAQPTAAQVDGRNRLVGVDSQLDPIPLLGSLARNVARQKHDRSRQTALAQVKSKVAREARIRMDRAADEKLDLLEEQFRVNVLGPLEQLALNAEPVEMFTTDIRAVMRLRMAGERQLAAHTPRPSAPSDSLISMQMHESALNNALAGLGLEGRRMTAVELHDLLAEKFNGANAATPEDLPRRARVEFAKHDAVRVAYHDDQLVLVLSIAELSHGRDRIRNFRVHAFFKPQVTGLRVELVRQGTLQFSGPRLRTGPRVALHSVFGKLLHKAQHIPVLAEGLEDDPRLEGLMVTQLVIDDGWLAVALGPAHPTRVAWRTRIAGMH